MTTQHSAENLASDLIQLEKWAKKMNMSFHPEKCKIMHLGKNNLKSEYEMTNNEGNLHTLEEVEIEKDLGILIDNELKFFKTYSSKGKQRKQSLGVFKEYFQVHKQRNLPSII